MAYNDKKIKLDSSQKNINDKFKNNIENTEEKIFWYIKFTLPLDVESVSQKTMKVTDTKGYILKTNIIYNKSLELIVIETLEAYEEEEYYILQISKDVRTENLKNLKRDVNILFKINGREVLEFKELSENIIVPKPRKKPRIYRKKIKSRVYSFEKDIDNFLGDKLNFISLRFNPFIAISSIPVFLLGIFLKNNIFIFLGIVLACLGFIHITLQITKKEFRSNLIYNLGVISFNKEKYKKAKKRFKKAITINRYNEYAEYAIRKVSFYL